MFFHCVSYLYLTSAFAKMDIPCFFSLGGLKFKRKKKPKTQRVFFFKIDKKKFELNIIMNLRQKAKKIYFFSEKERRQFLATTANKDWLFFFPNVCTCRARRPGILGAVRAEAHRGRTPIEKCPHKMEGLTEQDTHRGRRRLVGAESNRFLADV